METLKALPISRFTQRLSIVCPGPLTFAAAARNKERRKQINNPPDFEAGGTGTGLTDPNYKKQAKKPMSFYKQLASRKKQKKILTIHY